MQAARGTLWRGVAWPGPVAARASLAGTRLAFAYPNKGASQPLHRGRQGGPLKKRGRAQTTAIKALQKASSV